MTETELELVREQISLIIKYDTALSLINKLLPIVKEDIPKDLKQEIAMDVLELKHLIEEGFKEDEKNG